MSTEQDLERLAEALYDADRDGGFHVAYRAARRNTRQGYLLLARVAYTVLADTLQQPAPPQQRDPIGYAFTAPDPDDPARLLIGKPSRDREDLALKLAEHLQAAVMPDAELVALVPVEGAQP